MKTSVRIAFLIAAILLASTLAVSAQAVPQTIKVEGFGKTATLSAAELAKLLAEVGAPAGENLRGPALANVVLVTSRDGYVVAFGLAETDPAMRKERIILADRMDGRPLSERDGPFRLAVEGDMRAARFARQVASITVKTLSTP